MAPVFMGIAMALESCFHLPGKKCPHKTYGCKSGKGKESGTPAKTVEKWYWPERDLQNGGNPQAKDPIDKLLGQLNLKDQQHAGQNNLR